MPPMHQCHRMTPDQKIHYIDYTSLYPWVNKTCIYPKGPSRVHLAAGSHRHPWLLRDRAMSSATPTRTVPSRAPLSAWRQTHLSSMRHLRGTRNGQTAFGEILSVRSLRQPTSPDRYVVHPRAEEVRRIGVQGPVHLRGVAFPPNPRGLFQDYVNMWLKIKQESSGWPDWVGDGETKLRQYIHDYYQNEGIQLDYRKI